MESEAKITRKRNPRETANPLAALFFVHMIPIFIQNYKTGITAEDLYETLEEDKASVLGYKLETTWKNEYKQHRKAALHIALFKLVGFELIIGGVLKLFSEMVILVVGPYSIGKLVEHFSSINSLVTKNEAYMHAGIIIGTIIIQGVIDHPVGMLLMHVSMKMRISCCSLIYRKSLRLSQFALANATVGQIVNLLSNDVSKFEEGIVFCNYVWISPLQAGVATYLLYREIGATAFAGMGFLLLFIPIQIYFGKQMSVLRLKTALQTDERVRFMNEILKGIHVIKMYTWEKPFARIISYIRRLEIATIRHSFFSEAIIVSVQLFASRAAVFISIIVFISFGNKLTPETVYIIMAIYNALRRTVTSLFTVSIASLAQLNISVCRLHKFMKYQEFQKPQDDMMTRKFLLNYKQLEKPADIPAQICFKNVSAKWQSENDDSTLSNINLTIDNNQLVVIIGSVGSGKSSLLNVILRELELHRGFLRITGKLSYAAQEAWLFSASVRQNILFGEQYDEDRYTAVIKMCALETDLKLLPFGDQTMVGDMGKSLSGGQKARINLARCVYKKADIYLLDDPLSAVDIKVGKQLYDECIKHFLSNNICILVTHQLQFIGSADQIIILDNGRIVENGTYDSLQTSTSNLALLLEKMNDEKEDDGVIKNKARSRLNSEVAVKNNCKVDKEETQDKLEEVLESGHIKFDTFAAYFRAGGNYFVLFSLLLAFILNQCVGIGGDYFVTYWMNLEQISYEKRQNASTFVEEFDRTQIMYIYATIIFATIILALGHLILNLIFFMRASMKLHDDIFERVMSGTMAFFNANPTGRILNRFSKDIGIIDEHLPFIFIDVLDKALTLLGVLTITCIVSPWLLTPSIFLVVLFYLIRKICLETSRSVKRIEAIHRSPVFNYITASMHGLSTIRAFGAEKTLIREFDNNQDVHSSAWHLYISANAAFGFWLELINVTFISLVIISLLALNNEYYGGDVGLILTQYVGLMGILQFGMRSWTEMENNMTSVERVLEYTKSEKEPIRKMIENVPNMWPEHGRIIFQNVTMKYTTNKPTVLKNLNFVINSCEKIGIVGRTGAGKSSIIAALFQLYDIDGSIIIDDLDVTKLPLEEVRSKISVIPQDAVLFSGTIRKNLDPFEEYNDEVIWNALEQVELIDIVTQISQKLNHIVSESGANFSTGQRQLLCLARAIIRNNKILVMDEATANVDPHTDTLIQKSLRKNFDNCTVITMAHRLHTIMDSDRVLVLNAGNIVEFDHPYNLLQDSNTLFYSIVQTTGANESQNLSAIAKENFECQEGT